MWFLSSQTRRGSASRSQRGIFHPRLEALEDRCLLSAGALDTSFGNGGKVITAILHDGTYDPGPVIVQSDGKIVAVGQAQVVQGKNGSTDAVFAVARYNTNGSLDPTFGSGGIVLTNVAAASNSSTGGEVAFAVAIDGNGKIDVAGIGG